MRRTASVLSGLVCAAAAFATPALAYEIDPLTREPIGSAYQGGYQAQPTYPAQSAYPAQPGFAAGPEGEAGLQPQAAPIPRELVSFNGYAPGSVVVSTQERRLYYVLGGGQAIRYGIGVGRPGFTWAGSRTIAMKREWPDWRPPAQMLRRRPDLPRYMVGGVENPLGARAMYLGGTLYRIHGSNEPDTIGQAVSSGCIRMTNDDVVDLYGRAKVGTKVVVLR